MKKNIAVLLVFLIIIVFCMFTTGCSKETKTETDYIVECMLKEASDHAYIVAGYDVHSLQKSDKLTDIVKEKNSSLNLYKMTIYYIILTDEDVLYQSEFLVECVNGKDVNYMLIKTIAVEE